ncbi:MAG: hypothetical protein EOO41_01040, partial [Methanobacteriota archaeon]
MPSSQDAPPLYAMAATSDSGGGGAVVASQRLSLYAPSAADVLQRVRVRAAHALAAAAPSVESGASPAFVAQRSFHTPLGSPYATSVPDGVPALSVPAGRPLPPPLASGDDMDAWLQALSARSMVHSAEASRALHALRRVAKVSTTAATGTPSSTYARSTSRRAHRQRLHPPPNWQPADRAEAESVPLMRAPPSRARGETSQHTRDNGMRAASPTAEHAHAAQARRAEGGEGAYARSSALAVEDLEGADSTRLSGSQYSDRTMPLPAEPTPAVPATPSEAAARAAGERGRPQITVAPPSPAEGGGRHAQPRLNLHLVSPGPESHTPAVLSSRSPRVRSLVRSQGGALLSSASAASASSPGVDVHGMRVGDRTSSSPAASAASGSSSAAALNTDRSLPLAAAGAATQRRHIASPTATGVFMHHMPTDALDVSSISRRHSRSGASSDADSAQGAGVLTEVQRPAASRSEERALYSSVRPAPVAAADDAAAATDAAASSRPDVTAASFLLSSMSSPLFDAFRQHVAASSAVVQSQTPSQSLMSAPPASVVWDIAQWITASTMQTMQTAVAAASAAAVTAATQAATQAAAQATAHASTPIPSSAPQAMPHPAGMPTHVPTSNVATSTPVGEVGDRRPHPQQAPLPPPPPPPSPLRPTSFTSPALAPDNMSLDASGLSNFTTQLVTENGRLAASEERWRTVAHENAAERATAVAALQQACHSVTTARELTDNIAATLESYLLPTLGMRL